jgi:DNA-binding response OmpR family regulator
MIIDDEPENLNVLGEMLRQENWDVRAFPNGETALAAAATDELPDLVLLDIRMPGLDGYEVCRRFKADERLRAIPIIFLSAFTSTGDKTHAFAVGGVDYVTKPFAEIEVLARAHTHIRLHRQQLYLEDLVRQRVAELAEAHRRLRIWDEAKDHWIDTLSHEMRNSLNGVFGISELLFMELPPASDCHTLRRDYDVSRNRIMKLTEDALTLARVDVAGEGFALRPQRLTHLLWEAVDAVEGKVPTVRIAAFMVALEGVTVAAEAELLNRAFVDLLLAATRCVSAGAAIRLDAHAVAGQAHVVIATAGPALPPAELETFFAAGGRRDLPSAGDGGLGPALASRILRLFKGSVTVRNGPERGVVLEIVLPTVDPEPGAEGSDQ